MKKVDFINLVAPIVISENAKRGNPLYNSVVIAQAILETGWGNSQLMMKANAIFGIKATSRWKGKVYSSVTNEVYNGVSVNINATFRAYNNLTESVADYFTLICNSDRYKKALHTLTNLECITEIKKGGYATSPTYITNVMNIINSNMLYNYDNYPYDNNEDIDSIARDVIAGKYGNGEERKQKLGEKYKEVQKKVNEILGETNIDSIARDVIAGKYGNGEERKQKLGEKYEEVQKKVNEILKG